MYDSPVTSRLDYARPPTTHTSAEVDADEHATPPTVSCDEHAGVLGFVPHPELRHR